MSKIIVSIVFVLAMVQVAVAAPPTEPGAAGHRFAKANAHPDSA